MTKVSIIIPVYNVEKYLRQCLDSVVNQTLKEIEIICVDDGSTDSSPAILAEYATKDPRVKVLTREKSNAGAARNAGMAVATGEYLGFVDSDDWCEPTLFEKAYAKAVETEADVASWRYDRYDDTTGQYTGTQVFSQQLMSLGEVFGPRDQGPSVFLPLAYGPWGRLVRRSHVLSLGVSFQSLPRANDVRFCCLVLATALRQTLVDEVLYHYRVGMTTNLQAGNTLTPGATWEAWGSLAEELEKRNLFTVFRQAWISAALNSIFYTLGTITNSETWRKFYSSLRESFGKHELLSRISDADIVNGQARFNFGLMKRFEDPVDFLMRQSAYFKNRLSEEWRRGEAARYSLQECQKRQEGQPVQRKVRRCALPKTAAICLADDERAARVLKAHLSEQTLKPDEIVVLIAPTAQDIWRSISGLDNACLFVVYKQKTAPASVYAFESAILQRLTRKPGTPAAGGLLVVEGRAYRVGEFHEPWANLLALPDSAPAEKDGAAAFDERSRERLMDSAMGFVRADAIPRVGTFFELLAKWATRLDDDGSLDFISTLLHVVDYRYNREFLSDLGWDAIRSGLDELNNRPYESVSLSGLPKVPPVAAVDDPLVTFIVPIHDAALYLTRCLESLRRQTLSKIEILCIDDGSADETPEILARYAGLDHRIRSVRQEHAGVSAARNLGLRLAKGRYVAFVDGDDWVDEDLANDAVSPCESSALDVCYFDIAAFDHQTRKPMPLRWSFAEHVRDFPVGQVFRPIDLNPLPIYTSSCCGLYRKAFLERCGATFPDLTLGEDAVFVLSLLPKIERAYLLPRSYYHYRRGNSASALGRLSVGVMSPEADASRIELVQRLLGICPAEGALRDRILVDVRFMAENFAAVYEHLARSRNAESPFPLSGIRRPTEGVRHKGFVELPPLTIRRRLAKIVKARPAHEQDIYVVAGQLNSTTNEPIDSWTFFCWLQKQGIPSRYLIWKKHYFYRTLQEEGRLKDVIALDGNGVDDYEILDKCADVLLRMRVFAQENGALNYAIREWMRALPGCAHVFLQHGVFFTAMEPRTSLWLKETFNYVNVSSERERDFVCRPIAQMGYAKSDHCLIAGLPRWDLLRDESDEIKGERVVFVMFTWRSSFDQGWKRIEKSAYFRRIKHFFQSEALAGLRRSGVRFVVSLHHHLADSVPDMNFGPDVEIVPSSQVSYWIRHAKMLLTDYSSVSVDFLFQSKPVLYWLVDHDDFLLDANVHDDGGKTFSASKELRALFNIAKSENEVIDLLSHYVKSDFVLEPEKRAKADVLFANKKDICRHVYESIEAAIKRDAAKED